MATIQEIAEYVVAKHAADSSLHSASIPGGGGSGSVPDELITGGNTSLHFHDTDRERANHTGTQTADTISNQMGFSQLLAFSARHG